MLIIEILIILVVIISVYFLFFRKKRQVAEIIDTDVLYNYSEFEEELIDLIDNHRKFIGVSALIRNDYVSFLCKDHNEYMISKGNASHDYFTERAKKIEKAFNTQYVGENIAYNFSTPKSTFNAWMKSEDHKKNLEDSKWTHFGISNTGKFSTNIFFSIH